MSDLFYLLENCELCPRKCSVNRRAGERGYCNSGDGYEIASICIHKGEEPPLSGKNGICNVFFSHCNLQCVYCQNYQISNNSTTPETIMELDEVVGQIEDILNKGIGIVGFVSPTHFLPQVVAIVQRLLNDGYSPVTVWNSNAYELPEKIELLNEHIDVFMPDYKYSSSAISEKYSDAPGYPEIAETAIKKMMQMRGPRLLCDENGLAFRGMLLRHLVLPGQSQQSITILRNIEKNLSVKIPISLMSQYVPLNKAAGYNEINRKINHDEYCMVVNEMNRIGLTGWIQEFESADFYMPDFKLINPFGEE